MLGVVAEDRSRSANDIRKLGARRNEMFELDSEHCALRSHSGRSRNGARDPAATFRSGCRDHSGYVFASPLGDMPMNRRVMSTRFARGSLRTARP